jgi:hypothetical protein
MLSAQILDAFPFNTGTVLARDGLTGRRHCEG